MRGVGRCPGYFRDPDATAQVMRPGGWYASGDLGYVCRTVHCSSSGAEQMDDRSGFNVYPGEVEAVLCHFPGVQRAAVVGRREADGNEEILAFVETVGHVPPDLERLNAYLADHLAPYKRPSQVIAVEAFPMTHSGKVLKRQLLALHPRG